MATKTKEPEVITGIREFTSGEIVRSDQPADPMLALIRHGIDQKLDPESLKGLYELARQVKRDQAEEAFNQAVADFQAKCPMVVKRRTVNDKNGAPIYGFASYDDVMFVIGPILADVGLSIHTDTAPVIGENGSPVPGLLRGICTVSKGIHSKTTAVVVPTPALSGGCNATQQFGAAMKYVMRYAVCGALNVITTDVDDDAATQFFHISEEQLAELLEMVRQSNADLPRMLAFFQIDALDKLPLNKFPQAKDMLTRKAQQKGSK